jgi:hypothetical protein
MRAAIESDAGFIPPKMTQTSPGLSHKQVGSKVKPSYDMVKSQGL